MKKKHLIAPALCLASLSAHAQFVTSGGNTTTNDNVGIGTSTPAFKLEVAGTTPTTRTIGINLMPVAYFPVPGSNGIAGSLAFGNGLRLQTPFANGNTVVGVDAGLLMTDGFSNTATGYQALQMNATGSGNAAFGTYALRSMNGGGGNSAFGGAALEHTTTGTQNSALGNGTMLFNTTGVGNTAAGHQALLNNTSGYWNVGMGSWALQNNTTGNYNMALGTLADVMNGALTNATAIGARALVGKSNAIVLGDTTKPTNVGIGTAYPDYALDVRATANPVRLRGLQAGNLGDYLVTADANGVLRRIPASSIGGGTVTAAGQGLTLDGSTVVLGDYCGNGGGKFEKEREINMNDYALYFNSSEKGKIYMGVSSCQPLMTRLEISAKGLGDEINDYDTKRPSPSGLRFTNLTAKSEPIENKYDGVLSLDEDGDVIWVKACCAAGKEAAQYGELKAELEALKNTIGQKDAAYNELKAEVELLKTMVRQNGASSAQQDALFQNIPNPAGNSARIEYLLVSGSDAFIVVYDMNGRVMSRIPLQARAGKGSVQVDLGSWAAGTYSYTLFVNGQIRDTKKLQIAR